MEEHKDLKIDQPNLLVDYSEEIDQAFKAAVRDALLKHKRANNPVAVWRDGKVVLLAPEEILPGEK